MLKKLTPTLYLSQQLAIVVVIFAIVKTRIARAAGIARATGTFVTMPVKGLR